MKRIIFLAALCSVIFFSCKKDDMYEYVASTPTGVEGAWHYIGYSGGLAGFPFTPVNSGGPYIQVSGTQLIVVSDDNSIQKCMDYQFKSDTSLNSNYQLTGLLTTSDTSFMLPMFDMKTYNVTLSNDTLTLYPSRCADCFVAHYTPSLKHFNCTDNRQ